MKGRTGNWFVLRFAWIGLGIVLMLSALPTFAAETAYAVDEGAYEYHLIGEPVFASISGYYGQGGRVVIPSTLGGFPVRAIESFAFYNVEDLTSVSIPEGVMIIGDYSFCDCHQLEAAIIPASVVNIGDSAFQNCYALTSISFLGLAAPSTGPDWVFGDPHAFGHAYAGSDFPAPGGSFNGLPMGDPITLDPTLFEGPFLTILVLAVIVVIIVALVIFQYRLFNRKEVKNVTPTYSQPTRIDANEAKSKEYGQKQRSDLPDPKPSRNQFDWVKPKNRSAHCPWCGAQTADSPFCSFCGGKLRN